MAANGSMFDRPQTMPTWKAHLTYHQPMWGVLQSSYEHVEDELNTLRNWHLDKQILFVGGDGLSIMRVNWLLQKFPDLYIDSSPLIIPVQGEAPHGVYHIMHAGWRLYLRFIRKCAEYLDPDNRNINKQVVDDPPVRDFNNSMHFLYRMMRACSEYLLFICATPGGIDINAPDDFVNACERNIDLAWVVHFLYDFAFLLMEFKNAVRSNRSDDLDQLWREFLHLGRPNTSNKHQYCPMAIMRIFWSQAMRPELQQLYVNMRSIPMTYNRGARVGWDTPVEWLHGAITEGVQSHVSEEKIETFVRRYPLLSANDDVMRSALCPKEEGERKMKSIESDVALLKDFLFDRIGRDWRSATRWNDESELEIGRGVPPWKEMDIKSNLGGNESVPFFVAEVVRRYTSSFYSFDP